MTRSLFLTALSLLLALPSFALAQDGGFELTARSVAVRAAEVAPQVRVARAASANASTQADWALVSGLTPRVELRASYTRLSEITQSPFSFGGMEIESPFPVLLDSFLLRASVTVPVSDYFLTVVPNYEAAQAVARLQEVSVEVERQGAAIRAQEAYFGYVQARAAEAVTAEAQALLDEQLRVTSELAEAGEATPADTARVRAQRAEVMAQAAGARAAVAAMEQQLRTLLQLSSEQRLVVGEDLFTAPGAPQAASLIENDALEHRPEIQVLRHLAHSHRQRAQAAEGGRYPALLVVANLDYANPNQRLIPATQTFTGTWDLSVVLSWSPHNAVQAQLQADNAYMEVRRAEGDLEAISQQIQIQATQLTAQLAAARQSAEASDEAVSAARIALEARRDLQQAGEATTTELLDAELALRRANATRLDSYAAAHLANARIRHLTGAALAAR